MSFEASAETYDRHVGRYGAALAAALVGRTDLRSGDRAVDVGCGPGALTAELARRLGPERVAAVDPSETFVEACRARLPGVDVRLGGAERLPFADATFDGALSQLVVNFMADPAAGVSEMCRVTRPGGIVASCVWDYAEGMTMLRAFWDAALELDPDAPDEGRTMRYCREGDLAELWRTSGLRDVEDGSLTVSARYESFDDYWAPLPTGLAPSGAYTASLDPERQKALAEACFRRLGSPQGPFVLDARAWFAVGRV